MKLGVTGKVGQIATSLIERASAAGHEVVAIGRPELDLADPISVAVAIEAVRPDVLVSAAAYTAVDMAEGESDLADAINRRGAEAVASVAKNLGIPLVHISTDYVFDGQLDRPYLESDLTGPTSVYGSSKLAGENAVLAIHGDNCVILRVAWVYSPFGANFVKTMLRLASERDEISVVADQVGNPTSALDIADGILQVASNLVGSADPKLRGIFHMTAGGEATWAEFAEAIFATSAKHGAARARVRRISTAEYQTLAKRPMNSRLNCQLIVNTHGVTLPFWRTSLETVVARLQAGAD